MDLVLYQPATLTDTVIDVSHWQGKIDFAAVRGSGIIAAFIKATQGSAGHDALWAHNSYWAAQADLHFAPYHFMTNDPVADQFDNLMHHANPGEGAVVMLDFENEANGSTADADQVAELGAMLEAVTGRKPLIYCGRYQLQEPHEYLATCPLMLPQYGPDRPICPPGWSQWLFHQYSASGQVRGIGGDVDRSTFAGTSAELSDWWMLGVLPLQLRDIVVPTMPEPEPVEPEMEPESEPLVFDDPPQVVEAKPRRKKKQDDAESIDLAEREVTRMLNEEELNRIVREQQT